MVYKINSWEEDFEIAESRRHKKNKWLPLPNKMDGLSYRRITNHKHRHEIFSAWILLIQLASKMPVRGVLENELGPLDFDDMELMTSFPAKTFQIAIEFLKSPKIQWIVQAGDAQQNAGDATTTVHNSTVHNKTIKKSKKSLSSFVDTPFFEDKELWCKSLKDWPREKSLKYWQSAYDYSNKGNKYIDWLLAVQSWERKELNPLTPPKDTKAEARDANELKRRLEAKQREEKFEPPSEEDLKTFKQKIKDVGL